MNPCSFLTVTTHRKNRIMSFSHIFKICKNFKINELFIVNLKQKSIIKTKNYGKKDTFFISFGFDTDAE